ncbi:MAG: hypothetical protein J6Y33_00085 [Prevotella sp.]|nr:hypothetical protein [Prevotella sp.]
MRLKQRRKGKNEFFFIFAESQWKKSPVQPTMWQEQKRKTLLFFCYAVTEETGGLNQGMNPKVNSRKSARW